MNKKPNIIFLMSDQMEASVTDENSTFIVPNMRRLMADGVTCRRAYAPNPICSPSRASLMTGLLPHNHGMVDVVHNVPKSRADYDYAAPTFSSSLKRAGYSLCYYGKWHVEREHCLEKFGYDEFETERMMPSFNYTPIKKLTLKENEAGFVERTICGVFSEGVEQTEEHYEFTKAMDFIDRHKDGPFFAFISTNAPHDPYTAPKECYDLYENVKLQVPRSFHDSMTDKPAIYRRIRELFNTLTEEDYLEMSRCYQAYTTMIDMEIGRLVDYLKANNLYDNTLIVLLSDHGDYQGAHGLFCKGVAAFEEAYRIPLVYKLPNSECAGSETSSLFSTVDIAPTVLDIAGVEPMEKRIDGKTKTDLLKGGVSEDAVISENFGQRFNYTQRLIWKGDWKYVFNGFDYDELYNLKEDPDEIFNLSSDPRFAAKKKELCAELQSKVKETGDTSFLNATYFMLRFAPSAPPRDTRQADYTIYNKLF